MIKKEFITKMPEMLFFHVNRVEYTERFETKKMNDPFDFPKDLYIDRFMIDKAESSLREEQKIIEVEQEKTIIVEKLDRYKNYFGDRTSLIGNFLFY